MDSKIGIWGFIIGLLIAVGVAIFSANNPPVWAVITLGILGIIVGILNITDKEILLFLVASIGFMLSFQSLSAIFTMLAFGWAGVGTFFGLMTVFVAPATAIVAVKALYNIAKD